ncbi:MULTISPECIES: hypothetical protein [unclassified Alteromonas]|uniref:hypothetical protein n=1 Tax=unclassified Alteromonas TaxID=2614992 RepID=UPI000509C4BD|nr:MULTISPECIES: hypothetical protein [unclassified Alteromonas]
MSFTEKYLKYLNQVSWIVAEIPLLIPPAIVAYLFHPNMDYSVKLIIVGFLSVAVTLFNSYIGIRAVFKRDVETTFNFLVLPFSMAVFVLYLGFK